MSTDMLSFRAFPSLNAEKPAGMFSGAKTSGTISYQDRNKETVFFD